LDEARADEVMALLLALVRQAGASLLMVTPQFALADLLNQQIVLSKDRAGAWL